MKDEHTSAQHEQLNELSLLFEVSRMLDQSLDLADVVSPVLEAMAEHMDMRHGTLTLLNRKTNDILTEAAHGLSPDQARRGRYKLGEGITGQVVLTGKPAVIPRKSEEPQLLDRTSRGKAPIFHSFACLSMSAKKS